MRAGDAGGVYVAPDEIGEPRVLDADERAILGAWADRLVPGDGIWPPATATPVVGYVDALMDRAPAIVAAVRSALAWLAERGFLGLAQAPGGLSCFVVERGPGMEIQRLKDKLGTKSLASSEIEFRAAPARLRGAERIREDAG